MFRKLSSCLLHSTIFPISTEPIFNSGSYPQSLHWRRRLLSQGGGSDGSSGRCDRGFGRESVFRLNDFRVSRRKNYGRQVSQRTKRAAGLRIGYGRPKSVTMDCFDAYCKKASSA